MPWGGGGWLAVTSAAHTCPPEASLLAGPPPASWSPLEVCPCVSGCGAGPLGGVCSHWAGRNRTHRRFRPRPWSGCASPAGRVFLPPWVPRSQGADPVLMGAAAPWHGGKEATAASLGPWTGPAWEPASHVRPGPRDHRAHIQGTRSPSPQRRQEPHRACSQNFPCLPEQGQVLAGSCVLPFTGRWPAGSPGRQMPSSDRGQSCDMTGQTELLGQHRAQGLIPEHRAAS